MKKVKKISWKKILKPFLMLLIGFLGGLLATFVMLKMSGINTSLGKNVVSHTQYNNSSDVTKAVDKVKDAVVTVNNYQELSDSQAKAADEAGLEKDKDGLTPVAQGSGVIYKKDGKSAYVVTNAHVVSGAKKLTLMLGGETDRSKAIKGELIGSDTYSDIAVIKISSDKVTKVAEFADSSSVKVGETAIAIGSPLDKKFANTVTQGIISALDRTVTLTAEDGTTIQTKAFQTDAAINPGNSGGALINIEGQVIGINSSKISLEGAEGLGFAIPSNDVVSTINQLEKNGKISRPALGITMGDLSSASSSVKDKVDVPSDVTKGVVVGSVQSDMPADGKLKEYDVITKIDDKDVSSVAELQEELYKHKLGDTVTLTFYRDGSKKTADIKLNKSSDDLDSSSSSSK
ncbi:S1C family serine protease [Streptococcus sobrinus]|uniref:S1C family serine protease n=1 Tax=Streptococcus sobrinus TaxID=1310 RepID=UPI00030BD237|nr:trypsin-like peptidase domain-containing protein [Streptococcus sobrinus]